MNNNTEIPTARQLDDLPSDRLAVVAEQLAERLADLELRGANPDESVEALEVWSAWQFARWTLDERLRAAAEFCAAGRRVELRRV